MALVIPLGMHILGKSTSLTILVPLCLVALLLEWSRFRYASIARLVHRAFGFMMRPEEITPTGKGLTINGAIWVLLSATLLTWLFPLNIAIASLTMFMIADAVAALVGRPLGRHRWGDSSKTIEGSLAFFAAALLCLRLIGHWSWLICAAVAAFAMVLELLPIPVNDNIRVPVLTAGLLWWVVPGQAGDDSLLEWLLRL